MTISDLEIAKLNQDNNFFIKKFHRRFIKNLFMQNFLTGASGGVKSYLSEPF